MPVDAMQPSTPAAGSGMKYVDTGASPVCWMVQGSQCIALDAARSSATVLSPSAAMRIAGALWCWRSSIRLQAADCRYQRALCDVD